MINTYDSENKMKLEGIINKINIPKDKKEELIKSIYRDRRIPIIGIANELSRLNAELTAEDYQFIKDLYSKYGW